MPPLKANRELDWHFTNIFFTRTIFPRLSRQLSLEVVLLTHFLMTYNQRGEAENLTKAYKLPPNLAA